MDSFANQLSFFPLWNNSHSHWLSLSDFGSVASLCINEHGRSFAARIFTRSQRRNTSTAAKDNFNFLL